MFEVGDRVWSFAGKKWGVVKKIKKNDFYCVGVKFDGVEGLYFYTEAGQFQTGLPRTLFFDVVPIPESALKRPKWRAEDSEEFYCHVDATGKVEFKIDYRSNLDNELFKAGNYFKTLEEAEDSKFYKAFEGGR